jgi:hypothetical protein
MSAQASRPPIRYCDYYGMLSLKDFTERVADGTLDSYEISARTDQGESA